VADNHDPEVRVVDRRWWARGEGAATDENPSKKPTYVEELERRVADQATQIQAFAADRRHAAEEFEQARVRMRRDVAKEVERGKRALVGELLDVLDNLDRALAAADAPGAADPLVRGVALVRDQFFAKLAAFGVSRLPALGDIFDATRHEAVSTEPVTDDADDGRVVKVLKEGYLLGDELLRPAAVVVGKRHG
jgi:molecular chaperone GrpE